MNLKMKYKNMFAVFRINKTRHVVSIYKKKSSQVSNFIKKKTFKCKKLYVDFYGLSRFESAR